MKTQADRLIAGLEAMGLKALPKKNKYTMFQRADGRTYFVGKNGALRVANRPSVTASLPCNDKFRQKVLDAPMAAVGL